AVRARAELAEPCLAEVDQEARVGEPAVDLPGEVGAAAEGAGARPGEQRERLVDGAGAGVLHQASVSSTRWGVSGSAAERRPVACAKAFAIAAAVGIAGGSPSPFEPIAFAATSATSTNSTTISGASAIVGSL